MEPFYGFPHAGAEDGHLRMVPATTPEHLAAARTLIREYGAGLGIDLSFQHLEEELAGLPGAYAPPRGALLLALVQEQPEACVALRPLAEDIAEMKRLYVRPTRRGLGLGELLAQAIVAEAKRLGYRRMRLDTLATMAGAQAIYRRLGFKRIPAYYANPLPDVVYLELDLTAGA